MGNDLLSSAAGLFKGAADTESGISERAMQERVAADNRRSEQSTSLLTTGINNYSAGVRQEGQQKSAQEIERMKADSETQRTGMQQKGASDRQAAETEAQFITLTPQLKKGAKEVTGDKSWDSIPDGYKMRADVYSSLLSIGTKMADIHEPKLLEIQEGDQVYTAEYDPVTRQLTKKTSGGDKFSPDQRDGKRGGGQLNPFTLQSSVRQDEKTLLNQLGGKGKKGIPSTGILAKISGGKLGQLTTEEQAKIGTLRALATRLKTNYQNLSDLEQSRGLQPTAPDATVMDAIDKLVGTGAEPAPKVEGASGTKVKMTGPDNKVYMIPSQNVDKALQNGFRK